MASVAVALGRNAKMVGLQWGRALAAVSVVLTHAIAHPLATNPPMAHFLGRFGVTIFFVISGFIMVLVTGAGRFNALEFLRRRFLRVAPLYTIATIVTAAAALVVPQAFKHTPFDLRHIVLSLLFIPTYAPGEDKAIEPFVMLGWTLNYEMFFYVAFAALAAFHAIGRAIALTVIFCVLIWLGQTVQFESAPLAFYTRIDTLAFVAGVWIAVCVVLLGRRLSMAGTGVCFVLAALLAATLAASYAETRTLPLTQVGFVAASALVVAALASVGEAKGAAAQAATFLGDASYSIYLFHMFAVGAATWVGLHFLHNLPLTSMLAALGGVSVGVAVYVLVEAPINRLLRQPGRRRSARAEGQTAVAGAPTP